MKQYTFSQAEAENASAWLLNQPNLPYGLASIALALVEESEIVIEVVED